MKLQDIQEAKYHQQSQCLAFIERVLANGPYKKMEEDNMCFNPDDFDSELRALTQAFGQPKDGTPHFSPDPVMLYWQDTEQYPKTDFDLGVTEDGKVVFCVWPRLYP